MQGQIPDAHQLTSPPPPFSMSGIPLNLPSTLKTF